MSRIVDLRSDTVTKPTPAMRRAMAEAEVGDDVYGEDPTVNRLERRSAEIFGREAALFVPTGTMGNTIGAKLHARHGQEVICEARSHIFNYELSMMAWFSGCIARPVATEDGIMTWNEIRPHIVPPGPYRAPTCVITIETTHNMAGGTVYPIETIREISDHTHELGLKVHMDGARVFNAAVSLGKSVREITESVDTVMFCLSKGLGAPVGSMLVGTAEQIARSRLLRKSLGGGMRQVGVLAAAGLIALEEHPALLAEDHRNARLLADGLAKLPGIRIDPEKIQSNILIFDVGETGLSARQFHARMTERGVLSYYPTDTQIRLVTHYDVTRADCVHALGAIEEIARAAKT